MVGDIGSQKVEGRGQRAQWLEIMVLKGTDLQEAFTSSTVLVLVVSGRRKGVAASKCKLKTGKGQ